VSETLVLDVYNHAETGIRKRPGWNVATMQEGVWRVRSHQSQGFEAAELWSYLIVVQWKEGVCYYSCSCCGAPLLMLHTLQSHLLFLLLLLHLGGTEY